MPSTRNELAVMKHSQAFIRSLGVSKVSDWKPHKQSSKSLKEMKATAARSCADLTDKITDDVSEERASEIEGAFNVIQELVTEIEEELDYRSEIGDQSPRDYSKYLAKIPQPEGRTIPATCDGYAHSDATNEKFSLSKEDRMTTWAQPMIEDNYQGLTAGRYLRSMVTGAKNEVEARALAEGTDSAGGFTVPTVLASQIIDALRAESVCIRAGAQTVPLTSDNHSIAKVASEPTPAFRNEAASVAESDPTFTAVTFTPRSLMIMTKVSRELLDDSINISTALPNIITASMAAEMDRVCLEGSGVAPQPTGVKNQTGIGTTAHDAALTSYAPLLAAQTNILTNNAGAVNAFIMHPRDAGDLAALADTTNQPLNMPPAIANIPMLTTTSIAIDGGSGSNESTIYVGNFNNLMIGMRNDIRIEVLRERFADTHQYGFVAHMRFDVAVSHAKSFHTISGVQS